MAAENEKLEKICIQQNLVASDVLTNTYKANSKAGNRVIDIRIKRIPSVLDAEAAQTLKDEFRQIKTDEDVTKAIRYNTACVINGSNVSTKLNELGVPGIVENIFKRKYELDDGSSVIYLITKDCPSVADIAENRSLTVREAFRILNFVLDTTEAMHRKGFIHRCIGMGSVFYDKDEDEYLLGKFDYAANLNEQIRLPVPLLDDQDVSENFISGIAATENDDYEGFASLGKDLFGYDDYMDYESVSKPVDKMFEMAFQEPSKFKYKGLKKFLAKAERDLEKKKMIEDPVEDVLVEIGRERPVKEKTAAEKSGLGVFGKMPEEEPVPQQTPDVKVPETDNLRKGPETVTPAYTPQSVKVEPAKKQEEIEEPEVEVIRADDVETHYQNKKPEPEELEDEPYDDKPFQVDASGIAYNDPSKDLTDSVKGILAQNGLGLAHNQAQPVGSVEVVDVQPADDKKSIRRRRGRPKKNRTEDGVLVDAEKVNVTPGGGTLPVLHQNRMARAFDSAPLANFMMPTLSGQTQTPPPIQQNIYNIYNINGADAVQGVAGFDPAAFYGMQAQTGKKKGSKKNTSTFLAGFVALSVLSLVFVLWLIFSSTNAKKYLPGSMFLQNKFDEPVIDKLLTVRPMQANMVVGETLQLTTSVESTFRSADESVVTVDENGVVTAVGAGKTDVYVFYNGQGKSVEIKVVAPDASN